MLEIVVAPIVQIKSLFGLKADDGVVMRVEVERVMARIGGKADNAVVLKILVMSMSR